MAAVQDVQEALRGWAIAASTGTADGDRLAAAGGALYLAAEHLVGELEELGFPGELTGAQFTEGASADPEYCGCGEPITLYEGQWMHIISEELRGTGDHEASPG